MRYFFHSDKSKNLGAPKNLERFIYYDNQL